MTGGRTRVLMLWLSDVLCIASCWLLVAKLYLVLDSIFGLNNWTVYYRLSDFYAFWPVIFLYTGINWVAKLYHGRGSYPAMPVSEVEEFRRLVLSAFATHALVMAFLGFSRGQDQISRVVLFFAGVLTAFAAQSFRYIVRHLLFKFRVGQIPAFVVGDGAVARQVAESLGSQSYYGFRVIRSFGMDELREVVSAGREQGVEHLFACYNDDRLFKAQFDELAQQFTFIEYMPTAANFPTSGAQVIEVSGLGGLEMTNQRKLRILRMQKDLLDFGLSLIIFVLALPFFVIVPILIKLTSPGPVFYRAKRLGKKGRPIRVWKFRSMYADADRRLQSMLDADPELKAEFERDFKLKHDPRITPVGAFLRKTSIDELPQLFNVFARDMALIGPRPIVEKEVEKYGKFYEIFASVRPGITGLWQASGRNDCNYDERVALDVHYVLNWSPWMDLWVVFRTVAAVLKMKGSY